MMVKRIGIKDGVGYVAKEDINIGDPVKIDLESESLELDKPYTDEQLEQEFPEKLVKCEQCKKKFLTRFNSKFCSDRCFKKSIRDLRKKLGTWIKNEKRVKSTHRPDKNWKNPKEKDNVRD